jgi:hypothetical protein
MWISLSARDRRERHAVAMAASAITIRPTLCPRHAGEFASALQPAGGVGCISGVLLRCAVAL